MAAKTTVRVSLTNNAAKDDSFSVADYDWLSEDGDLQGDINVLGNDPGSATLIGVSDSEPTLQSELTQGTDTITTDAYGNPLPGNIYITKNSDGTVAFDATELKNGLQYLDDGESVEITFYYTAQMANGAYSTAKVTISISGENDAPVALSDNYQVNEDEILNAASVLGNDTDVDIEDIDVAAVRVGGVEIVDGGAGDTDGVVNGSISFATTNGGQATINLEDGTFTYDQNGAFDSLNDGEQGADSFEYKATDGDAESNWAAVNITIDGVTDPGEVIYATLPETYTGTDDPNDHDDQGDPLGTTITGSNNGSVVDNLFGGAGDDTINAQNGDDNLYGGEGSDILNGGNGSDTLYGGSGNDTLNGDNGSDILIGGYGADQINGGNGGDLIRYLSLKDTNDTIVGFNSADGDKIDLSAIDADSSDGDNDAFIWGGQVFDYPIVQANSVTWYTDGTNVELLADTDGDITTAEFHITLSGITSLAETDFNTL